jgi:hypothetical protein
MPSPHFSHTRAAAEAFRAAVSAGEFRRAEALWSDYTAECLAQGPAGRRESLLEMRELMEWTRIVVLCSRAQALRKLTTKATEAHAAGAYARAARVKS